MDAMKHKSDARGTGRLLYTAAAALFLAGGLLSCATAEKEEERPEVHKAHYLDEGSTIVVGNDFMDGEGTSGDTLLEKLKTVREDLEVECEKNALLAQELITMREARDKLKEQLDASKTRIIELNEEISGLKRSIADQTSAMDEAYREKKDLLEKLVNLKLEKIKLEKEVLKIKIAALSGEG